MKTDIAMLMMEYDRLYDKASAILKADNPCQIQKGEDGRVTCVMTRCEPVYDQDHPGTLCCGSCKHLGPDGCTVQALACKVWSCYGSRSYGLWPSTTIDALRAVRQEARSIGVPLYYRQSKEETFETLRRIC